MPRKEILLCADDFGLNPGVCQGILKLVQGSRLSAVSCMVNAPDFSVYAQRLLTFQNRVQLGLHFNLTQGFLLSTNEPCFNFKRLVLKSCFSRISPQLLIDEFHAQLERFEEVMGIYPDFIDGHQHVHQLPGIRQVILNQYNRHLRENGTYLRSTYPVVSIASYRFKSSLLAFLGGKSMRTNLGQLGIPHNACFSGIYDFAQGVDYRALFCQWLHAAPTHTLIMCHPGESLDGLSNSEDEIAQTRSVEFAYFLSDAFIADLKSYETQLSTSPKPRKQKAVYGDQAQN